MTLFCSSLMSLIFILNRFFPTSEHIHGGSSARHCYSNNLFCLLGMNLNAGWHLLRVGWRCWLKFFRRPEWSCSVLMLRCVLIIFSLINSALDSVIFSETPLCAQSCVPAWTGWLVPLRASQKPLRQLPYHLPLQIQNCLHLNSPGSRFWTRV